MILIDEHGQVVDGDSVLAMCALELAEMGLLKKPAVVATVMSNIGLELALRDLGIDLVRCAVGDKYVMEEMAARGLVLGGEQSGHVIFPDLATTGGNGVLLGTSDKGRIYNITNDGRETLLLQTGEGQVSAIRTDNRRLLAASSSMTSGWRSSAMAWQLTQVPQGAMVGPP